MYCRECSSQQDDGRFCRTCGRPLDELPGERRLNAALADTAPALTTAAVARAPVALAEVGFPPLDPKVPPGSGTDVAVNVAGPRIIYEDRTGPGLLLRGSYFVLVGWWVGFIWLTLASLLNLTLIGLPLGLIMINRLPLVMTLTPRSSELTLSANPDGTYALTRRHLPQPPFGVRAVYFICVGWWASFLWVWAAYAIGLLIVTLPISFWMWNRVPAVTTLARY